MTLGSGRLTMLTGLVNPVADGASTSCARSVPVSATRETSRKFLMFMYLFDLDYIGRIRRLRESADPPYRLLLRQILPESQLGKSQKAALSNAPDIVYLEADVTHLGNIFGEKKRLPFGYPDAVVLRKLSHG